MTETQSEQTDHEDFLTRIIAHPLATVEIFSASCVSASAKAMAFVTDELGLTIEKATQQQVGFSDRTLGKQLPSKRLKAGREIRETLQELDLYKANVRETLRGYGTVSIHDDASNVIGIRGQKISENASGPEEIRGHLMGQAS